jgi:predicted HAD superfamily phosphohydrolase YqeG
MDTQSLIPILNDPRYKGIIFDFDETIFKASLYFHTQSRGEGVKVLFNYRNHLPLSI